MYNTVQVLNRFHVVQIQDAPCCNVLYTALHCNVPYCTTHGDVLSCCKDGGKVVPLQCTGSYATGQYL